MKVLYLLPVQAQARFRKRIAGLMRQGLDGRALYYERDYYPAPPLPCPSEALGRLDHGRYLQRIRVYLASLRRIRRAARQHDTIYCFGPDLVILAWLATWAMRRPPKLILEVGDIRPFMNSHSRPARAFQFFLRRILNHVSAVVVTSPAYITGYFQKFFPAFAGQYVTIENKLPADLPPPKIPLLAPTPEKPIRIGYFGLLRCGASWHTLKQVLVESEGRFVVKLAGEIWFPEETPETVLGVPGVEHFGTYNYPDDLDALYGDVDIVWVAHHHSGNNLKWARVNRFYEACFFRKPMIAQQETQDGAYVAQHGLGMVLDLGEKPQAAQKIQAITAEQLLAWTQAVRQLPNEVYQLTGEHKMLADLIRQNTRTRFENRSHP